MSLAGDLQQAASRAALVSEILRHALQVKGEGAKQWYLHQLAFQLGVDSSAYPKGTLPSESLAESKSENFTDLRGAG